MIRRALLLLTTLPAMAAMAQESIVVEPVRLYPTGTDHSPVLMDSTVVMCSLRERPDPSPYRSYGTSEPFSDLYAFA